jgi:hypothetical protein
LTGFKLQYISDKSPSVMFLEDAEWLGQVMVMMKIWILLCWMSEIDG